MHTVLFSQSYAPCNQINYFLAADEREALCQGRDARRQRHVRKPRETPPETPTYTPPEGIFAVAITPEQSGRLRVIKKDPRASGFAAEISNAIKETMRHQQEQDQLSTRTICIVGAGFAGEALYTIEPSEEEASGMHADPACECPTTPIFEPTRLLDVTPGMHSMHAAVGDMAALNAADLQTQAHSGLQWDPVLQRMHETNASSPQLSAALFATFVSEEFEDSQPLFCLDAATAGCECCECAERANSMPSSAAEVCAAGGNHESAPEEESVQKQSTASQNPPVATLDNLSANWGTVGQHRVARVETAAVATGADGTAYTGVHRREGFGSTMNLKPVSPVATTQHACTASRAHTEPSLASMHAEGEVLSPICTFPTVSTAAGVSICAVTACTMDDIVIDSVARLCMGGMALSEEPSLVGVNTVEALTAVHAMHNTLQGMCTTPKFTAFRSKALLFVFIHCSSSSVRFPRKKVCEKARACALHQDSMVVCFVLLKAAFPQACVFLRRPPGSNNTSLVQRWHACMQTWTAHRN